jgi:hypothetical protein
MPKLERASSLTSTPKVQSVSRALAGTPVATVATATAPSTGPVTEYAGQAAPPKELLPRQASVSKSASPSALWGEAPKQVDLDPEAFKKLSPSEQKKVVEAAKVEREKLGGEIVQRVEVLDKKWNNSRLSTRTEALREYADRGRRLDRRSRQRLDGLVVRSEESQRKINELRVKIDALPKTPEAKKAMVELRNELARELRRARDEQSKVVKEATEVIDTAGLKVERLAVTEQIIDPSAPAQGSGDSLLDKIVRFFKLDTFFGFVRGWVAQMQDQFQAQSARHKDEMKVKDQQRDEKVFVEKLMQAANDEAVLVAKARATVVALAS